MDATTSCVARGWNNGKLRLECKEQRGQQVLLVLGVTCNLIISWGGVSCFIWDVVVYTRYSHLSNVLRKIALTENFIRYQLRNMFFEGKWLFISYLLYFVSNAKNIPYASASKAKYEKFYSFQYSKFIKTPWYCLFPISSILTPLHSYRVDSVW